MSRSRVVILGSALLLVAKAALAWSQGADFSATVHGHAFKHVEVESKDCVLDYRIYFDAPAEQYTSPARARDVFLFRTRIDFASGKSATVPVFANRAPGARVYENHFDSTTDGCWVKEKQALRGVKVEGCRGAGCTPEPIH